MLKKAGSLFSNAYLIILFAVFPLFMSDGYAEIGKDKYGFFLYLSLAALGILGLIGVACLVQKWITCKSAGKAYIIDWSKISITDLFVLMYGTEVFLSYALGNYRQESLWGVEGWYMGLITQVLLCALYFIISRMWDGNRAVWILAAVTVGVVCLLGILDRFSIYLIPIADRQGDFLSTIGNINWLCGYLAVTAPIGTCLFLFSAKSLVKWMAGIYVAVMFGAAFAQGGSSIFLFMGALFYLLLWIGVTRREWLRDWFLLLAIWGFSAQGIRLLRLLLGNRYNYETGNLCGYLTASNLTLWIGAGALLLYVWFRKKAIPSEEDAAKSNGRVKRIHKWMCLGLLLCAGGWLLLAVINTLTGIPGLEDIQVFTLDDNWGNGRGATFRTGCWLFGELPWTQKLLGVGPDGFSASAYELPGLVEFLRSVFGGSRLTNAHNELLTCLVNQGIMGLIFYLGMFGSFLVRCMKKGVAQPVLYMTATCIFCYLVHNMVSFAQVLNFPFAILILAMGEKLLTNSANLPTIRVQSKENE